MAENGQIRTVSQLGQWRGGGTPAKAVASYWGGDIPWVSPKDMTEGSIRDTLDRLTKAGAARLGLHSPGDIAVVFRSGILRRAFPVARGTVPFTVNQDLKVLHPGPNVDAGYAFHVVRGLERHVVGSAVKSGTTVESVDSAVFYQTPVYVPQLAEQRAIAEILDTVDEAIRSTDQRIAKLERMKQGLLHDLLTRGIDDNGEMRDPRRYPTQFDETRLGRLPTEWRVETLANVAALVTSGSRGWARYYSERGALFIRIGNLSRESIDLTLTDVAHVRPPVGGEGKRTRLEEGDLLISITADLGITGVVPKGLGEAYVNQHIALVRVDPQRVNRRWLGHFIAARGVQTQIRRHDDPGAKAGLNLPTVRGLFVAVPPIAEQDEMASQLDAAGEAITGDEAYRDKLNLLKIGLEEDLLSGRVRVTRLIEGDAA